VHYLSKVDVVSGSTEPAGHFRKEGRIIAHARWSAGRQFANRRRLSCPWRGRSFGPSKCTASSAYMPRVHRHQLDLSDRHFHCAIIFACFVRHESALGRGGVTEGARVKPSARRAGRVGADGSPFYGSTAARCWAEALITVCWSIPTMVQSRPGRIGHYSNPRRHVFANSLSGYNSIAFARSHSAASPSDSQIPSARFDA
jgi:hypothetical protein